MKNSYPVLLSIAAINLLWLPGCILVSVDKKDRRNTAPPVVTVSEADPVYAEINAINQLFSESNKVTRYRSLARREGLTGRQQVYLIESALQHLFSESNKMGIMLALIENPCFHPAGKQAVLKHLPQLFSESNKTRVLEALDRRGPLTPPRRWENNRSDAVEEPI